MDGIGDYIYIIVLLGFVIINFFRNLNKQKQAAVPVPDFSGNQPESSGNTGDDFWGNFSPPPRQEPQVQVQHKPKSVETLFPKNEVKNKKNIRLNETEKNNTVSVAFNNSDDARRAFIYSEIWNRKY